MLPVERQVTGALERGLVRAAELVDQTLRCFYEIRKVKALRKRPSTSELVDWIAVLRQAGVSAVELGEKLPFLGALLKKEQDLATLAAELTGGRRFRA